MTIKLKNTYIDNIKIGNQKYSRKVNVYNATKIMSDAEISSKEGYYFDEAHYKKIIKNESKKKNSKTRKLQDSINK